MSYWQEVNEVIKKGIDLSISNLKETADSISGKTKESVESIAEKIKNSTEAARVRTELFFKQRQVHDVMAEIGDGVYDAYQNKKNIYEEENIKTLMTKAEGIIKECKELENRKQE